MVCFLLEAGADKDRIDAYTGGTPLTVACVYCGDKESMELVRILLEARADVDKVSEDSDGTPLAMASRAGKVRTCHDSCMSEREERRGLVADRLAHVASSTQSLCLHRCIHSIWVYANMQRG